MFWKRLASGIVLLLLAVLFLYFGGGALALVVALLSLESYKELVEALGIAAPDKKKTILLPIGFILILILDMTMFLLGERAMAAVAVCGFMVYMGVYVFAFPKYHSREILGAFGAFFYGPVLFSFLFLTRELPMGKILVWLIFISSWGCDTCAYCVGVLLGKHKMSPVLSPHKSVEGAIGGVAGAALLGALYGYFTSSIVGANAIWVFPIIGGMGGLLSMVGDLSASAIKRNHQIKDYANLIPGHGGVMDRFDSMLFTAPVIYYLSVWILK